MSDGVLRRTALRVPALRRLFNERNAAIAEVRGLQARVIDLEAALARDTSIAEQTLLHRAVATAVQHIRDEFTALPRFAYHLPLDYETMTLPPDFDPPVFVDGGTLPLPPPSERHGHSGSDTEYLNWGRYDHDVILGHIRGECPRLEGLRVMDFGCSSGRVLRHFHREADTLGWKLFGVDVSARRIEWMRRHFPRDFTVYVGSTMPLLPFASGSLDVIYGMSVFTHIKFLWDMWLLELRRVLKPGGVLLQTVHTEEAWKFFHDHREEGWTRDVLAGLTMREPAMPADYVYYGDLDRNQVFWKTDVVRDFWGRYFEDVRVVPVSERYTYQNWVVARKGED